MEEQTFEKLAADAAAGLKADQEVYRDVTQELHSFLEDKAERYRREGHSDEESVTLAKKAFGSPMDVAAELLNANRGRLRLRALLRIGFNAVIIPLAVLLALYLGYGRLARLQNMQAWLSKMASSEPAVELPTLPFLGIDWEAQEKHSQLLQQSGCSLQDYTGIIRRYWETHRNEPDSYMVYAYYAALFQPQTERREGQYVSDMRLGEQIEPKNALYNLLLADYYFRRGVLSREDNRQNDMQPKGDLLLDRQAMELGLAEMRKAAVKPYLRAYQGEILQKKFDSLPRPLLTEDYLHRIGIAASELFPSFASFRNVARRTSAAARILAEEGRTAEAEAAIDTWKPYALLLSKETNPTLIHALVSQAVAMILAESSAEVYRQLGDEDKAQDAQATFERLQAYKTAWRSGMKKNNQDLTPTLEQHGSVVASIMFPVFPVTNNVPALTARDLTPGRMHEHILFEEIGLQGLQVLLALFLLGTVIQGMIWHFRLRNAASVPLLLMPPAREILRVLWWGLVLPILIYAVYSRLPVVGGREYNWGSHWWRFGPELLVLGILVLWLPARLINRYVRRRCEDLDILLPPAREERSINLKVRSLVYGAILLTVIVVALPIAATPPEFKLIGIVLAMALVVTGIWYASSKRNAFGLYYGTLARSMAPLYAFAILLLMVTVQPLLLYREADWLRRDTLIFSALNRPGKVAGFSSLETRVAQDYTRHLAELLGKQ